MTSRKYSKTFSTTVPYVLICSIRYSFVDRNLVSTGKMENLMREQAEALANELSELSKQQSEALQTASYFRMSAEEAMKYDERRLRIARISSIVGKFKASSL